MLQPITPQSIRSCVRMHWWYHHKTRFKKAGMSQHGKVHSSLALSNVHLPLVSAPGSRSNEEKGRMKYGLIGSHGNVLFDEIEQGDSACFGQTAVQPSRIHGWNCHGALGDHHQYE